MTEPEELADNNYFELMVTRFLPRPKTEEFHIKTVQELDECLASVLPEHVLTVSLNCVSEEADWGSFVLLLCGERALVHLIEGPCLSARDPSLGAGSGRMVKFQDDAGFAHEVPFEHTLAREQGLKALRLWLPRGERLTELPWTQV
jgi:hypothetical protein